MTNHKKFGFTCLVKHFRSNPLFAKLTQPLTRFSQTKFRSIAAHSYGFTLAEVIIVLAVLGIVAVLTLPGVVKKYQEAQARMKVKKSMAAYDTAINKMVIENDLRSETALKDWAEPNNCANSVEYFKKVEREGCVFKTSDGVWWDVSDIMNPVISLNEEINEDNQDEIREKANDSNYKKAFALVANFDNNGSLRVNDLAFEANIVNNSINYSNVKKLYDFITMQKNDVQSCNSGTVRYYTGADEQYLVEDSYDSKGNLVSSKTIYGDIFDKTNYKYDNAGNKIQEEYYNTTGNLEYKKTYAYDGDNIISEKRYGSDNSLNSDTQYSYTDGKLTSIKTYDGEGNLGSETIKVYDGDNLISEKVMRNGNVFQEYRYTYLNNKLISKEYYLRGFFMNSIANEYNGENLISTKTYDYNRSLSSEAINEYNGNTLISTKTYNGNGNLSSDLEVNNDGTKSYTLYDSNGNIWQEIGYDSNNNMVSGKYYDNGNLYWSVNYEYDKCGRRINYKHASGNEGI